MWVLKLGGSLNDSEYLIDWLRQAVHVAGRGASLILVPGGGAYADQVRRAQMRWGFDDQSAHRMALLAMEQTAAMLCALQHGLTEAGTERAIRQTLARGGVPVWRPSGMALADPGIAADWTVTSDSLALWLAGRVGARGVLLVKSADWSTVCDDVASLQGCGLLDRAFRHFLDRLDCPVGLMRRDNSAALSAVLNGHAGPDLTLTGLPAGKRKTPAVDEPEVVEGAPWIDEPDPNRLDAIQTTPGELRK